MTLPVIDLLLVALGVLMWPERPSALAGRAGGAAASGLARPPRRSAGSSAAALPSGSVNPTGSVGGSGSGHAWNGSASGFEGATSTTRPILRKLGPAAGIALATTLVSPSHWWAGVSAAVLLTWFLGRRTARPTATQLRDRRRELAGRLELLAACLRSGLPVASAMSAVTHACGNQPGRRAPGSSAALRHPVAVLEEVAALLAVGADPAAAWVSAAAHPDLASIAAAASRSATGGSTLAAAFTEQAELLRRQNSDAAAGAAGRAGVMMTAPLGACFLPAFLCLGLAPAVVGLLGTLRLW